MPNDAMAALARELAETLIRFAHDRHDDDRKHIAELHTRLCSAYRSERIEEAEAEAQEST